MSSWNLNPATGDYIMVNGAPQPTESLTIPCYYRIKIPRKQWMYAPNTSYGSDLNTIKKKTGTASLKMIEAACQPIVTDGRASSVSASYQNVQPSSRNSGAVQVAIVDAQGTPQNLNLPPVGD